MNERGPSNVRTALVLLALGLAALCLRGPIAAVGPLISDITSVDGLSTWEAAVLTGLPLLMFGLLAPLAPILAARFGARWAVAIALALIGVGLLMRTWTVPGLFLGSLVIGTGIAVGNVLLIVVAKAELGPRWPYGVAVTTAALALSAAAGASAAAPTEHLVGNPLIALALWFVPVAIALVVWVAVPGSGDDGAHHHRIPLRAVVADPTARAVTLYFGMQALVFYSLLTWFVAIVMGRSESSHEIAGVYVGFMVIVGFPTGLVVPKLAMSSPDQRRWVVIFSACALAGVLGLLMFPAVPFLWSLLCGLGCGGAFPLALTLVGARTTLPEQTAALSAAAQTLGYVLASFGPPLIGLLLAVSGDWMVPLVAFLVLGVIQAVVGLRAATPGFIRE